MGKQSGQRDHVHVATTKRFVQPSPARSHELTSAAAVLKDTVYLDGGSLYWTPGMADGSFGAVTSDGRSTSDHLLFRLLT